MRIIAFDRPGYGGSTQTPFGLASVAGMAVELADRLGVDQFRTTGWSGGGPFEANLPAAQLTENEGERHLRPFAPIEEMLKALFSG